MRLGWGGSYTAQRQETLHAQKEFFLSVEKNAPHAIEELSKNPFEAYKLFYETLPEDCIDFGDSRRNGHIQGWESVSYADEYTSPQRRGVRDTLLLWAKAHQLEAKWVLGDALNTLHWWCWSRFDGCFYTVGAMEEVPYEPEFTLNIRRADLKLRTFEEELERFDTEYKRARDAYCAELKETYESWGKEAQVRHELEQHLEMFVLYRCCDVRVPDLIDRYGLTRQTVYGVLKDMCELLQLPRAVRPSGRPRK